MYMFQVNFETYYSNADLLHFELNMSTQINGYKLFIMGATNLFPEFAEKIIQEIQNPDKIDRLAFDIALKKVYGDSRKVDLIQILVEDLKKCIKRLYFTRYEKSRALLAKP